MADEFDFEKLYELLYTASKKAFVSIQLAHKNEAFYVFGFFTSGQFSYLTPTASTEEGLMQVVQMYSTKQPFSGFSTEELRKMLRWSPCDSPLQSEGEEYFEEVNKLVWIFSVQLSSRPADESWDEFDRLVDKFLSICIKVLKRLDSEGVFGVGERRNSITLNILMGDQSDKERLKFAELLNPPSVYNYFKKAYLT